MKFLLATNNPGKLRELREILSGFDIVSLSEAGVCSDPEETGESFEENAFIKARAACLISGLPTLADDSGLCIDALSGEPGIHSARYAPVGERKNKVLSLMAGKTDRKAHFSCVAACVFPDGKEYLAEGRLDGEITFEKKGQNGFGYDPIFFVPEYGMTLGEMPDELKNTISHRRAAFAALKEILKGKC